MGSKHDKESRSTDTVEDNSTSTEVEKTTETFKEAPIEQNKVKKKTSSYHENCTNTGGPSWDWIKGRKSSRSKSSDSKKSGNVSNPDSAKTSNDDSPKYEKKTSSFHANCIDSGGPSPRKSEQKSSRSTISDSKKSGNVSSPDSTMSNDDSPKDEKEIKKETSSFHANCASTEEPSWAFKKERKSSRSVSSDSEKSGSVSSPDSEKMSSDDSLKDEKEIKKKTSLYHTNCKIPDGHNSTWKTEQKSSTSTREDSKKSGNVSSMDSKNKSQDDSPKDDKKIKKETCSRHDSDATLQSPSDINKNTSKKMDPVTGKKKSNQATNKNNQDNKPFPNSHKSSGNIDGFVPRPPSTVKYSRSCNCVRNSSSTASKSTENQNQAASKATKKKNQAGSKRTENHNKVALSTTENQKEVASKTSENQDAEASKTTEKQNQYVKPFPSPKENDTTSDAGQGTETIDSPQDEPKIDANPF